MFHSKKVFFLAALASLFIYSDCSKKNGAPTPPPPPPPGTNDVDFWLTRADQTALLEKQTAVLSFSNTANSYPKIEVDSSIAFQQVDGFGYTLTGGSAYLINHMSSSAADALLNDIFSPTNGIGVSYIRISIGASDLSPSVFTYDDMPAGQTDPTLANFTLAADTVDLVPVLKKVLLINPNLKIMGSPWTPPVWMKDNGNSMGGSLKPEYYSAYANYFVKYLQTMKAKGIPIHSITIQNEPLHGGNNPSMVMTATEQANFIKNNLGPAFQAANISTKIIIWDHNCDNPNYPITILNDAAAKQYIDGSAFHLYGGDISALSTVHNAHPDKNLYFTEQWTSSTGNFNGDLQWHLKNVVIGSMNNWSKIALEWNLANDPTFGPHTPGGCTMCKGALTIDGSGYTKNVAYYIIAHASKFIPAGSARISSTTIPGISSAAFKTPSGKKVLLAVNDGAAAFGFNISYKGKWVYIVLPAGSAGTFIW